MIVHTPLRSDLKVVASLVPEGSTVLDIGCGDGDLLSWLITHKQVNARGIEIATDKVNRAIAAGVPVIQGDIETDLAFYSDHAFDVVILSQTLQAMRDPRAVLSELLRIGKTAIVSVPNFAHWRNRFYLALKGEMPVTKTLIYEWYDTPNIHFCSLSDFVVLCERMNIKITKRLWVDAEGKPSRFTGRSFFANLLGEQGVFLLARR